VDAAKGGLIRAKSLNLALVLVLELDWVLLRIVTWNIKRNTDAFAYARDVLKADAIFFQESPGLPEGCGYTGTHRNIDERGAKRKWGNTSAVAQGFTIEDVPMETSYVGSLITSLITTPEGKRIGVINMYGLFERPTAQSKGGVVNPGLHRRLSDVAFWLYQQIEPRVDAFIILGDWNQHRVMDQKFRSNYQSQSANLFFDRLQSYSMVDLVSEHYSEPPQTYRAVRGNYPWQLDHIFVSKVSFSSFSKPEVDDSAQVDSISDHRPVVTHFGIPASKSKLGGRSG
jgi:hypothetical protein